MKFFSGKRAVLVFLAVAAVLLLPLAAQAITFTGSSGDLAAEITFTLINNSTQLQVVLTNTSSADVLVPSNVLTAVFWDMSPSVTLTRVSAQLNSGSTVLFGGTDPGGVVGGEWAYKALLSGAPGGAGLGVSSSGLSLFAPEDRFPGTNLQGPDSVDGLQYGITSAGDDTATGNPKVTGSQALIKNSVVYILSGSFLDDNLPAITNVSFQYGTDFTEPNIPGDPGGGSVVPIPPTMLLVGSGLLGLAGWRKFRKS
jgi:hypothetical protein